MIHKSINVDKQTHDLPDVKILPEVWENNLLLPISKSLKFNLQLGHYSSLLEILNRADKNLFFVSIFFYFLACFVT